MKQGLILLIVLIPILFFFIGFHIARGIYEIPVEFKPAFVSFTGTPSDIFGTVNADKYPIETIQGRLISQTVCGNVTTYILQEHADDTSTTKDMSITISLRYTFKVVNGKELELGKYYYFKAIYIGEGVFAVVDVYTTDLNLKLLPPEEGDYTGNISLAGGSTNYTGMRFYFTKD